MTKEILCSMLAQSPLPDDLWVNLASHLTIEDLYSLCDTCRHLRDVLLESKTVWLNLIHDLLAPCPNITIARSLKAASTSDLKKTCDRYRAANSLLDIQPPRRYIAVTLSENQYYSCAIPFTALGGQLVPGLACIAYASSNGSVHLVSTKTGELVDTWSHPEVDAFDNATIQIFSSETRGVMILVVGELNQTPGLPQGYLWLFAVDSSSPEPSLVPLMTRHVVESIMATSARDNTFAYIIVGGSPAYNTLAIVDQDFTTDDYQQVSPRLYRFGSKFHHLRIFEVVVFFPDVLGVITDETIALFRISEGYGQIDRHSSPPVLMPYWTHSPEDYMGVHGFFLGPLHISDPDTCLLALCINYKSYTLRISRNASECEVHFVSYQICSFISRRTKLELCLQGRGTCAIRPWVPSDQDDDGMLNMRLYRTQYFKQLVQYMGWLPPSQSQSWGENEVHLSIPRHPRADVWSIGYDEWTGTIAIQWTRRQTVGAEPEYFMTVTSLLGAAQGCDEVVILLPL